MTNFARENKTVTISKASRKDTGLYTLNLHEVALCAVECSKVEATTIGLGGDFIIELKVGRRIYPVVCTCTRKGRGGSVLKSKFRTATFRYMGLNVEVGKPAVFHVAAIYTISRGSS